MLARTHSDVRRCIKQLLRLVRCKASRSLDYRLWRDRHIKAPVDVERAVERQNGIVLGAG